MSDTPERAASPYIDSTAVVDEGATIGTGTKVWHFSHVLEGARVGMNCTLGQNVMVASTAILGNNVKVQNNVSIYDGVVIEDDVFCGPSVVFTNVINPRAHVNRKNEYRRTIVRRGATLGANSTIICGVEIGEFAFVGAGAVVTRNVPPYALVIGNPAKQGGWVCECGYKLDIRPGFQDAETLCVHCGLEYRLKSSTLKRSKA